MTDLSKKILKEYMIRKSSKEKENFRNLLKTEYPDIIEDKHFLGTNMILGDIKKAKFIFTAHYDTPAKLFMPNKNYPKNFFVTLFYQILLLLPFIIFSVILQFLFDVYPVKHELLIHYLFFIGYYILLIVGPSNKNNYNDNTSGVVTLIELINKIGTEKAAFVFFDNEEKGLLGSAALSMKHNKLFNDKIIINFDCVADGDNIMLLFRKDANKYKDLIEKTFCKGNKNIIFDNSKFTMYPSDQVNFKHSIAVTALNKGLFGLYLDKIHTDKDTVFDEKNIEIITDSFAKFIKEVK